MIREVIDRGRLSVTVEHRNPIGWHDPAVPIVGIRPESADRTIPSHALTGNGQRHPAVIGAEGIGPVANRVRHRKVGDIQAPDRTDIIDQVVRAQRIERLGRTGLVQGEHPAGHGQAIVRRHIEQVIRGGREIKIKLATTGGRQGRHRQRANPIVSGRQNATGADRDIAQRSVTGQRGVAEHVHQPGPKERAVDDQCAVGDRGRASVCLRTGQGQRSSGRLGQPGTAGQHGRN